MLNESIRRAIGQHFVVGFHGDSEEPNENIRKLISEYYVGNVILFKRNIASMQQVHKLASNLQTIAKDAGHRQPLMIGIDQENGLVSAFSSTKYKSAGTQFPGAMALAATGSSAIAREVSHATALELKSVGINWAFSPVADVNTNPKNPVIGVRSFGDDPKVVSEYVVQVANGLRSGGVAACAKHFPGHGDTEVDSHFGLPVIDKPLETLQSVDILPFQAAISESIASIMTAHIALPNAFGHGVPASLSPDAIQLLRQTLCYQGVVVTDCLEMEAVVQYCGTPGGAVRSLIAGADIAMICHRFDRQEQAILDAYAAFEKGELTEAYLKDSGKRIADMKSHYAGEWSQVLTPSYPPEAIRELQAKNALLSQASYAASTTVVQDSNGTLPLSKGTSNTPALLLTPQMENINPAVDDPEEREEGLLRTKDNTVRNTAGPSYLTFADTLSKTRSVKHAVYGGEEFDIPDLGQVSSVIFVTRNANRNKKHIDCLQRVHQMAVDMKCPFVVLSTCNPYDVLELLNRDAAMKNVSCICSFEYTPEALEAAGRVIFGDVMAKGRMPVGS